MGAYTEISVRLPLTQEQVTRLKALTGRVNQNARDGLRKSSPEEMLEWLMVPGISKLVDDRLDWLEDMLNRPLRR